MNNLEPVDNYNRNCYYCEKSKAYINRAFICDEKFSCLTKQSKNSNAYCSKKNKKFFVCSKSRRRIQFFLVCNYIDDCQDASDEQNCGKIN